MQVGNACNEQNERLASCVAVSAAGDVSTPSLPRAVRRIAGTEIELIDDATREHLRQFAASLPRSKGKWALVFRVSSKASYHEPGCREASLPSEGQKAVAEAGIGPTSTRANSGSSNPTRRRTAEAISHQTSRTRSMPELSRSPPQVWTRQH